MLTRPTFDPVRLREGYDMAQVDDLVDRIYATLEGRDSLTGDGVREARFNPVRLREGYDMGQVDRWLKEAGAALGSPAAPAMHAPPVTPPAAPATHTSPGGGVNALLVAALVIALVVIVYLLVR